MKRAQTGTWIENEQPSNEITEVGFVFARGNETGHISKNIDGNWKQMGRISMYGDGVIGNRMSVVSLDKRHTSDFITSAVKSVAYCDEGQIIRTASGTLYRLEITPTTANVPDKNPVESALAAIGERLLRLFK